MIKRQKIYYSEQEIETSLYTQGGEYMDMDNNEYIGYYHKYLRTGEVFTEIKFDKLKSKKLKPFLAEVSNKSIKQYIGTTKEVEEVKGVTFTVPSNIYKPNQYVAPISYYPILTQDDYKKGHISRYFIKKRNDRSNKIMEINKESYNLVTTSGPIDGNLWERYSLRWKISGPLNDIKDGRGITIESGISDTNKRILRKAEKEFRGISFHLQNLIEFGKVKQI